MPDESAMAEAWMQYRRTAIAEMADWHPGFDMTGVSVSEVDAQNGSPREGDKIARNPKNHDDKWLVAAAYFAENFEATGRAEAPDADEEAHVAHLRFSIESVLLDSDASRNYEMDRDDLVDIAHEYALALIAYRERRYVEALEQERAQFQRETLRTSELHRMLERAGSYIREVDGPDSPLARAFAREISELLAKPINAAAPASPEVE